MDTLPDPAAGGKPGRRAARRRPRPDTADRPPPDQPTDGLLRANHLDDLRRSGLADEQIRACGFRSEADPAAVARLLGWKHEAKHLGPCMCIPFHGADGSPLGYVRCKPDRPRAKGGKPVKYESPLGVPNRAYFPPGTRGVLSDAAVPLLITEGEKKAAKAAQEGFPCIGLVGVYGWQRKRGKGEGGKPTGPREPIPDLTAVAWAGRRVYIVYDSDFSVKPGVLWAEWHLTEWLHAAGAVARVIRLPGSPNGEKVGLDDFLCNCGPDALRLLMEAAQPVTRPGAKGAGDAKGNKEKSPPAADALARIGLALDLWHDSALTAYATIGRHTHAVRSKTFRHFLISEFRKRAGGRVPNADAVGNALNAIEAHAVHDGPERSAHVRIAECGGTVFLHLADADSTVIEIDVDGWRVCESPPVRFRKPAGMLPLPMPERGGKVADLRTHLNVPDDNAFALVVAWITSAFRPAGPFPVLVLLGEQGSAKSTTAKVVKRLIDPNAADVRCEPREARDLMIQARHGYVLAFDNLTALPGWLSDSFCRLATGGGFGTRELYTNDDEVIFDAKRPVAVNGIEDFVTRADLLERSLLIRHPPIPEHARKPESVFWAEFDAARPKLLGAVLDRVSAGLRELPRVALDGFPRMADFALFAVACERGAGEPARFLNAYAENQAGAHEQALDASPLPAALVAFMDGKGEWEGTPAELLDELDRYAPDPLPKDWPKKPNVLTNKLRRLAPNLRRVQRLDVDCDGRLPGGQSGGKRSRRVRLSRMPERGREPSSPPSPGPASAADAPPHPGGGTGGGPPAGGRFPHPPTVPRDRPRARAANPAPGNGTTRTGDGGDGGDGPRRPCSRAGLFGGEGNPGQRLPD